MSLRDGDLAAQLDGLRPQLLRFARLQLRNDERAEDAVQETLVAVLEKPQSFAGQSALKTWVIGILKHKIVDQLRAAQRETPLARDADESDDDALDALFTSSGHFADPPRSWGDPHASLERHEFFEVLQACIDHLPKNIGRIFMMREWLELETEEICKELDISTSNCWVMLYRARMRLRECLELNWFGQAEKTG